MWGHVHLKVPLMVTKPKVVKSVSAFDPSYEGAVGSSDTALTPQINAGRKQGGKEYPGTHH